MPVFKQILQQRNYPTNQTMSSIEPAKDPAAPKPETLAPPVPANSEDDFGDEPLGERQAEACSLDEGCTVCQ